MKIEAAAKIMSGQDGAIYNSFLFRFDHRGNCRVYDLSTLSLKENQGELKESYSFTLDHTEYICPHSNAVFFGRQFFSEDDSYPLLYSNVYNNYSGESGKDKKEGVCCVYRLQECRSGFSTALVQIIRIGFTDDPLWRSSECDVRPYGNFTADADAGILYAFTMRNNPESTRYFSFDLPDLNDGKYDPDTGIRTVTLNLTDIRSQFDCEYHRYIQGACCHKGLIYSVEGFSDSINRPALRIIDPKEKKQLECILFGDYGLNIEAEMIDFFKDSCLYSDADGMLYHICI